MKATGKLLVAALAAAGIVMAADAQAARGGSGGGASRGSSGSHGNWSGSSHGNWSGGSHGHWSGGHGGYWHGSRYYPRYGFYFGVPVFWGSYYGGYPYWGSPYWYDNYPNTVIYRDVEREPYYPEGRMEPPTTEVPRAEGAPSQGPLYMNYCESAKAYFPKVTTCPEGWKLRSPAQ